jgi:hypothetical protein
MKPAKTLSKQYIPGFPFGRKAVFTAASVKTGGRYTIISADGTCRLYFEETIVSPDVYTGSVSVNPPVFRKRANAKLTITAIPAVSRIIRHIYNIPYTLQIYRECKRGKCEKTITEPESAAVRRGEL